VFYDLKLSATTQVLSLTQLPDMAPALVPKIIKRQAKKLTNYVGARIYHEYDEATLKGKTFMRLAKVFLSLT
jgi:hypothetical protein